MAYIQATSGDRTVYLSLVDVPAASVGYTDVTVRYKKNGSSGFSVKTMTSADWINLGQGMYTLRFSSNELDTLGNFTFTVAGPLFDNFIYDEFTIEPAPSGAFVPAPPMTCVVSGTVKTVGGVAPQQLKVVARAANFPATYGDNLVSADTVWTYADSLGNFSMNLVQGATLLIDIERVGIRAVQIRVPFAPTANLIDLMPPIPIDYSI